MFYFYKVVDDIGRETKFAEDIVYIAGQLSYTNLLDAGYDFLRVLLHCKYNGQRCGKYKQICRNPLNKLNFHFFREHFVKWNDVALGNCITFNHRDKTQQNTEMAGSDYGIVYCIVLL